MIKTLTIIAFLLAGFLTLDVDDIKQVNGVGELNDNNFQEFITSNKYVLVLFYSSDCQHSKKALEYYAKISEKLNTANLKLPVVTLNADESPRTAGQYAIKAVPVLKFFAKTHPITYSSTSITPNVVFEWIETILKNKFSDEIKSLEDLEEIEDLKIAVLLYLPKNDIDQLENFNFIGATFENIPFYYTFNEKHAKSLQIDTKYGFIILRKFDDGKKIFGGDEGLSLSIMNDFLKMFSTPVVDEYTPQLIESHRNNMNIAMIYFSNNNKDDHYSQFKDVCFNRHISVFCVFANRDLHDTNQLMKDMGMDLDEERAVFLVHFKQPKNEVYKFENDFNFQNIDEFVMAFFQQKLNRFYKTQLTGVPEKQDTIMTITTANFDEIVMKSDFNVVLLVNSQTCHSCGEYKPILHDLVIGYASQGNFLVCQIDGELNDHEHLNFETIPSLFVYLIKDKTKPIEYKGNKNIEEVKAFVSKNLKVKLRSVSEATDEKKKKEQAKAEGRVYEEEKFDDEEQTENTSSSANFDDAGEEL